MQLERPQATLLPSKKIPQANPVITDPDKFISVKNEIFKTFEPLQNFVYEACSELDAADSVIHSMMVRNNISWLSTSILFMSLYIL